MADSYTNEEDMLSEENIEQLNPVYRTYGMDHVHKRIRGMIDGEESVRQAIWKILSTRRFAYFLYDDQYGCDIFNKIGDADLTQEYLESDIPAMIEDALSSDPRITGVSDFYYEILDIDSVHVRFTANTIYGDMEMEGILKDGS